MESVEKYKPPHLLSSRSRSQNRDVFYFVSARWVLQMRGGFDSRRHKLTISMFYRWLKLLDEGKKDFDVFRVELTRIDVMRYTVERVGDPLPHASTELLEPGDYVPYYKKGNEYFSKDIRHQWPNMNFVARERQDRERAEDSGVDNWMLLHNEFTPDVCELVQERDERRCCITGRSDVNTRISWLIPPAWVSTVREAVPGFKDSFPAPTDATGILDLNEDMNRLKCPSNAITIDTALFVPFMENKFGVDVDDDYRIILFEDLPEGLVLGSRLPISRAMTPQQDAYLRIHFVYCLGVNVTGGDACFDYPDSGAALMEYALDKWDDGYDVPDSDDEWQTEIGKEVLSVFDELVR